MNSQSVWNNLQVSLLKNGHNMQETNCSCFLGDFWVDKPMPIDRNWHYLYMTQNDIEFWNKVVLFRQQSSTRGDLLENFYSNNNNNNFLFSSAVKENHSWVQDGGEPQTCFALHMYMQQSRSDVCSSGQTFHHFRSCWCSRIRIINPRIINPAVYCGHGPVAPKPKF